MYKCTHLHSDKGCCLLAYMDTRLKTDSPQDDDGWNVDRIHILLSNISTRMLMFAGVLVRMYQTSISI